MILRMTAKVSIIVPCYNEEDTIANVIEKLNGLRGKLDCEIIAVDDGSTDRTFEIMKDFLGIRIVRNGTNRGKGAAVSIAAANAAGDVVAIQDADLEYDPADIPRLVKPILNGECEVVYGSRFKGKIMGMSRSHYVGNRVLSFFASLLYGTRVTDIMTGHKTFKTSVFRELRLKSKGFEFEVEVTARVLGAGHRITEVPITYHRRQFGAAKIKWTDGVMCLFRLVGYRLGL